MQQSDKSSISNEYYMNFLIQTSNDCFNICCPILNKPDFSETEKSCVESCFSKYFVAYESVNNIVSNTNNALNN